MKIPKAAILFAIILSGAVNLSPASADKGAIPIDDVVIYQAGQLAAIAWREGEEVLILSSSLLTPRIAEPFFPQPAGGPEPRTELVYNKTISVGRALEVLALASMPEVEAGDLEAFKRLSRLAEVGVKSVPGYGRALADVSEGVQVVYHEVIGAHDVTVVKAKDADELLSWVINYTERQKLPRPRQHWLNEFRALAHEYVDEGYPYFVFDLVSLGTDARTVEPLVYRFRSKALYYPLRISSLIKGYSTITLFLVTHDRIKPESIENQAFRIAFEGSVRLSEVEAADRRLGEPFKGMDKVWLTVLTWRGNLGDLKRDLNISIGFSFEHIKPIIASSAPVAAAVIIIGMCYLRAYRRILR